MKDVRLFLALLIGVLILIPIVLVLFYVKRKALIELAKEKNLSPGEKTIILWAPYLLYLYFLRKIRNK